MRGLFLRIFLAMWVAMTLAGASFAVVYATDSSAGRRRGFGQEGLRLLGESARMRVEAGRREEVRRDLERIAARGAARTYVIEDGRLIVGAGAPSARIVATAREVERTHTAIELDEPTGGRTVVVPLERGVVATTFPPRPSRAELLIGAPETLPVRLAVVFLVVGLVAYALARYLTGPLSHLRGAAQTLAGGDLSVRVSPQLGSATEEIAALGQDFDRMAERIAALLEGQERLLRDVSHELRSPLARLTVALALARNRAGAGPQPELDRIEREAERLSEMIGHILSLARLSDDAVAPDEHIELAALVGDIVRDADYEARGRNRKVELVVKEDAVIRGFDHALRSAIENVVRNAVAFTAEGTAVRVTVETSSDRAKVRVRDHGQGVPEDALLAIFRPFYRVGESRDRGTGGTGLGLAIAARVAARHQGEITAANAEGGGLEVTLSLPLPIRSAPARA